MFYMTQPLNKVFPHGKARDAADAAVDAIPDTEPMTVFLDAWEAEYFRVAGSSPMRTNATR